MEKKLIFSKCTDACTHMHSKRAEEGKAEAGCSLEAVFLTSATARPPCCAPPARAPRVLHNVIQSTSNSLSENSFHWERER